MRCPVLTWRIPLRARHAVSGTDIRYAATRSLRSLSLRTANSARLSALQPRTPAQKPSSAAPRPALSAPPPIISGAPRKQALLSPALSPQVCAAIRLRPCYAMSGTEAAHAATRVCCYARAMRYPVLT
eukprot:2269827-Rhodomonas_salina.3